VFRRESGNYTEEKNLASESTGAGCLSCCEAIHSPVLQQKKEAHLDLFCIQIEKLIRLANRSIAMFAPGYRR